MDNKPQILGTGLGGLVGSRIVEILSNQFEFEDIGVDITNYRSLKDKVTSSNAPIILHLAAKTDVDACEDDKILGEEGGAWSTNVIGTANIVETARLTGKKVIYMSTGFVFDGTKEYYLEDDEPNPVNWYGETKCQGEEEIKNGNIAYNIVRIDYPYSAVDFKKKDFVHKIIEKLEKKEKIRSVTDQVVTPTYIDDIAYSLSFLFTHDFSGIFHLVGSQSITPYEAATEIADHFGFDKKLISQTARNDYFRNRAFRPFKLALKNDKITKFGIHMRSFSDGIREFKKKLL